MKHPTSSTWPYRKVKPEHVPILIEKYNQGQSARKICETLPFSEDVALKVLRDFGVPVRTRKEIQFSMGSKLNKDAFPEDIDEDGSYFFGWLLTDGYIIKRKYGYQVGIEINSEDRYILEGLCEYLNLPKSRVKDRTRYPEFRGVVSSNPTYVSGMTFSYEPINERLISFGLEERKSLKEDPSPVFNYNRHFWRGVFEGDGYISKIGSDNKLQICGGEKLCRKWVDYCRSVVPEMNVKIYSQVNECGTTKYYTYSGKSAECKKVLDSLYLGVPHGRRLERKYNIYVERFYNGEDPNRGVT